MTRQPRTNTCICYHKLKQRDTDYVSKCTSHVFVRYRDCMYMSTEYNPVFAKASLVSVSLLNNAGFCVLIYIILHSKIFIVSPQIQHSFCGQMYSLLRVVKPNANNSIMSRMYIDVTMPTTGHIIKIPIKTQPFSSKRFSARLDACRTRSSTANEPWFFV